MRTSFVLALVVAGILVSEMPAGAHHSFSGTFDTTDSRRLDGTVVRVEWRNPHAVVHIRVVDAESPTGSAEWAVELGPPSYLTRNGWPSDTLRPGMEIGVTGHPAKTGERTFGSLAVTIKATGQVMETPPGNWMPGGAAAPGFVRSDNPR